MFEMGFPRLKYVAKDGDMCCQRCIFGSIFGNVVARDGTKDGTKDASLATALYLFLKH